MSKKSVDLERSSTQYAKITDASQTGLDLNTLTSFRIDAYVKLESTPTTGQYFGLVGKYDSSITQRGYDFSLDPSQKMYFIYASTPSGGSYCRYVSNSASVDSSDIGEWRKFTAEVTPGTQTIVFKKDDVVQAASQTLSGATSVANTTADFTIGKANGASNTMDGLMAEVYIYDTSGGSDVLVDSWTMEDGDLTSSTGNNDLTAVNTPTYKNDHPLTDISKYGSTEGADYVKMTINAAEVDATLTDFPVYLDLAQIDSGDNFWSTVSSDGSDIRVTNNDGTVQYPVEVVEINTGSNTGQVHFKIDSLSSSADTDVRVYYDGVSEARALDALYGRNEVWSEYEFVWHLKDTTDSTGNGSTLTGNGGVTLGGVSGQMGSATDFDGSDDYITAPDNSFTKMGTSDFTLQSWVKYKSGTFFPYINKGYRTGTRKAYSVDAHNTLGHGLLIQDADSSGAYVNVWDNNALSYNQWYKHTVVIDRSNLGKIFVDGSETASGSVSARSGSLDDTRPLIMGARWQVTNAVITNVPIVLGGVRGRKDLVDSNWESTENNNQSTPASFWSYNPAALGPTNTNFAMYL